jgi:NAD(P)-dependent dehydrogenase (short-subunit alcohol dehydrogenase family)
MPSRADTILSAVSQAGSLGARLLPLQARRVVAQLTPGDALGDAVDGRTVLVTGASSGIGRAAAKLLAAKGGHVIVVARRIEQLEAVRDEIVADGGQAFVYACDLSDPDAVEALTAEVLAAHPRVHILVNNAGRSIRRSVRNSQDRFHDYERTIQLNYLGAVKLILELLPQMREHHGGQIVNVSTEGVLVAPPRYSAYLASKAALDMFASSLAAEVLGDGVTVSTVHMPLVRTPMSAPTKIYERMPALSPEQAAELIGEAIAYRSKRVGTPVGSLIATGRALSPAGVEAVLHGAYRLTGRRTAGRG